MFITTEILVNEDLNRCLSLAKQGDGKSFCRVAEMHQARLLRQAAALCGDLHEAEDLVAETMIAAWRSMSRYNQTCRFSTWLYAILLHRYQKCVRRKQSRPVSMSSFPADESGIRESILAHIPDTLPDASESLAKREFAGQLRAAVASLPEPQQAVVFLRFFGEASLIEISAALGAPLGTVKSRLHHALETLRNTPAIANLLSSRGDI